MTDDVGLGLHLVLLRQVDCEGGDYPERCRLEVADCTPDCTHQQ